MADDEDDDGSINKGIMMTGESVVGVSCTLLLLFQDVCNDQQINNTKQFTNHTSMVGQDNNTLTRTVIFFSYLVRVLKHTF